MYYNQILQNIILPVGDLVFKSKYTHFLREVNTVLKQNRENILENQKTNLECLLKHALSHSKYYKELETSYEKDHYTSLKKFPILTKDIIRSRKNDILTKTTDLIKNSTSGSTGIQTEIFIDKNEQSLIRAIQTTWWQWAGYEIGKPIFQTGLGEVRSFEKKLKDIFFRTHYQFAFGLTEENTQKGLDWASRNKPFLGGYASSLYVLSQIAEGKNIKMKSAVSWGDKLFDHYKDKITSVFDCKVFETYGTGEGLMLGSQKDLDYLYIMDPYFIVELLNDDGEEVEDGQIGHVVVTSLIHKTMPLIRYKVGDLAIKLPRSQYPINRELNLSIFQKIIGRETDIVKTPKGRNLIVHSFTGVFEYFPEIKQFQVLQKKGYSDLIIKYIERDNFSVEILQRIQEKLDELANEDLNIVFEKVDHIPDSKSGKPQIVIIEN